MRRRKTEADDVLFQGEPRQTEKKTERLNALARGNHTLEKAIEERKDRGCGWSARGNWRRRRRCLSPSQALDNR